MDQNPEKILKMLSQSIQFGDDLLYKIVSEVELSLEHKIILSLYRKLLEQVDASYVLGDHRLKGPSVVMARSVLETYLSIMYILEQNKMVASRASSYYLGVLISQQNAAKELKNSPISEVPEEKINKTLEMTEDLINRPQFSKQLKEWEKLKNLDKNNYDPKWYSLFNGPRSVNALIRKLDKDIDKRFYGYLSQEAHGYQALNGVVELNLVDKPLVLKPLRQEHPDSLAQANIARSFCNSAGLKIVEKLFPSYRDEYIKFLHHLHLRVNY